ncbi:MAG: type II toxin-antitoxin system HicA family toxin [Candidatus Pacearchaeota archaeon]|jgi:predicted RNA binding protein YcfA (HicA-like mRNA interferase family)
MKIPNKVDGRKVIKKLVNKFGWKLIRSKGSHHFLRKGNKTLTVVSPKMLKGNLKTIERVTGIPREDLL